MHKKIRTLIEWRLRRTYLQWAPICLPWKICIDWDSRSHSIFIPFTIENNFIWILITSHFTTCTLHYHTSSTKTLPISPHHSRQPLLLLLLLSPSLLLLPSASVGFSGAIKSTTISPPWLTIRPRGGIGCLASSRWLGSQHLLMNTIQNRSQPAQRELPPQRRKRKAALNATTARIIDSLSRRQMSIPGFGRIIFPFGAIPLAWGRNGSCGWRDGTEGAKGANKCGRAAGGRTQGDVVIWWKAQNDQTRAEEIRG